MVSDPNLAIAMIALGLLAIYAEFCLPGKVVPGIAGGVLLLLGLASIVNAPAEAHISWPLAAAVGVPLAVLTASLLHIAARARRNKRIGQTNNPVAESRRY